MNKFCLLTILLLTILANGSIVFAKEVSYTLEDRDRLVRVETTLKEFKDNTGQRFEQIDKRFEQIDKRFEQIDKRFEQLDKKIDTAVSDLRGFMMWGFGVTFSGIFILMGFVIWDRKTALSPAINRIEAIEKRERNIEDILKEFSKKEPRMAEVLDHAHLT